ncbi:MAG: T9SS type A sorting domain-containing protein, partial [Bacteroidota bacterium]
NAPGGGGGGSGIKSAGNPSGSAGGVGNVTISFVFPDVNAVASSTLASCTATSAALTATAITAPGWTGAWQCVGCTGITIANPASASTTASGFTPGSTSYFQWVATYTATGCSVYDDLNIAVPNCPITNNNCANATVLTVNAGLMCGQSTTTADFETGECYAALPTPNQGLAPQSLWYRITATNDSLVLNIAGYGTNGPPSILVFGPFAPGAGCLPACSSTVSVLQGLTVDPGVHTLLTGLATTGNHDYLIAVDGFGNANFDFCINMANPAINSTAPTNALVISNCGATYNGSTNGGYYPSGTSTGANNLDGNNSTTVAGASQTGDDVTFVVNNISWFKFCTVNAGTYNVQFDVLSCVFSGASSGSQMAILTGTSTNLTNIWQATNPTTPATAVQTSPSFALAAGGCAYLVVDGFAGDACSYSYVLNNITGGCILLPMELLSFNGIQKEQEVDLTWATGTEKNNDYFTIERSDDGINFKPIETVDGAGISSDVVFYSTVDKTPLKGISYYRLRQTDYNGRSSFSNIISVDYQNPNDLKFDIVPNPNQENAMSNIVLSNIPDKEVTVLITDMRGVNLYEITKKTDSNKIEIPNGFSNGIYFVKVICSDFVQTKRMIIK